MNYYDFNIAGLLLRVGSQFKLGNLFDLTNFATDYVPAAQPDVEYTLQSLPPDWQTKGACIHEDRRNALYEWQDEIHRYYFWNVFSKDRYVLLRYKKQSPLAFSIYLQEDDLERILPQFRLSAFLAIEQVLMHHRGFILHASVVDWCGQGILFSAPSGTGKSTQADLWERLEGAQIINGDRATIRHQGTEFRVYGSPYAGTSGVYTNLSVPIKAIVVLSQGSKNTLQKLTPAMAFQKLYREATANLLDSQFMQELSDLLIELTAAVPVYHLSCLPNAEAVSILKTELLRLN